MNLLPLALASLFRSTVPSAAFSPSLRSFHTTKATSTTALGYRKHSPIDDVSTSDIVDLSPKAVVSATDPPGSNAVATSPEEEDTDQFDWFKVRDDVCFYPRTLFFL